MKITQIMLSKGFGGAERYFTDLSIEMAARGNNVQIICNRSFLEINTLKNKHNIEINALNVMGWWDPLALNRIRSAINSFSPDIVHAHLSRAAYIAGKATRDSGAPLVVKTHNYVNLKYYKYVDRFITTTADQRRYLIDKKIPPEKVVVIPNFSMLPGVDRPKLQNSSPVIFASYGRMVRKKGFDVLLKSFHEFVKSDNDASLVLGGDGPERKALEKLCLNLGLKDKVVFHGWIKDVRQLLSDVNVFVLPSLDEPFGIVLLEVMSSGIPIVTTRTKGPMDILNNDLAYFVDKGNVNSLAEGMARVVANREAAVMKASKALELYKKAYSGDIVIPKIEKAYRDVCEINSKHGGAK